VKIKKSATMWPFRIVIPGTPIPWKRPAHKSVGFRHWRFDSQKDQKEIVRLHLSHQCKLNDYKCPSFDQYEAFRVKMWFYLPVNESSNIGQKNAKLWGFINHNEKPDFDNLTKFYLDCANGILWTDDKKIIEGHSKKVYSNNPRTIIEIMPKENLEVPACVDSILRIFGPNELKEFAKDVKALSFLHENSIDLFLEESEEPTKERWLAWVSLLLSRFARSHADNLKKILKFTNIEEEVKEMKLEGLNEQIRRNI